MVSRFRVGAAISAVTALGVWTALSACSSSVSGDDELPPTREAASDPGCKVIDESAPKTAGRALSIVHAALADDAGPDASSDAGADGSADAAPGDAAPPEDASVDAAPGEDVGLAPSITAESVRTVACREGTTLDVAAGPNGGLYVAGGGIRGQVVTFSEGPSKTRVALYLRSQNAVTRIATLADGRPALVGMATENGELTIEEGEGGQRPIGPASSYGTLGRIATNATGSIAVATSSESAFVRSANGEVATRTLSDLPIFGTQPVTATVGIGNDGRLFRVTTGGPPSLLLEDRSVSIDGNGSVRGAAFTTLGADTTLPALALVRGDSGDADRNSFELAIPSGDGYARVEVVPAATPCKADPQCSSSCTEENVEVEPQEIALAWDGSRALAAFVRRAVTRDRRYQRKQGSGIVCDFIGCDPYCSSSSSGRTTSADLVIAAIDVGTRTVRELFALPLEVQASMQAPLTLPASSPMELRAYARDGHLHVALTGKYQGSFDAVSVYRFRTSP